MYTPLITRRVEVVFAFAVLAGLPVPSAVATVISTNTNIAAGDLTYDNQALSISGGATVTISGNHGFSALTIFGGSTLTQLGQDTQGVSLAITGTLNVAVGGRIDVTGKGYRGGFNSGSSTGLGETFGAGGSATTSGGASGSSGGSYGGLGQAFGGSSPSTYGVDWTPLDLGSGGGSNSIAAAGGNGGGVIHIQATDVVIDGLLLANGAAGTAQSGGGGGGSIWLDLIGGTFSGSGTIGARGGAGTASSGAGGGGRIAITNFGPNAFFGTISDNGGGPSADAGTLQMAPVGFVPAVPEPSALGLMGIGALALYSRNRRKH